MIGDIIGVPGAPVLNRPAVLRRIAEAEAERDLYRTALERIANHPERNHLEAPDQIAREALEATT